MAYDNDVTWTDLVGDLEFYAGDIKTSLLAGHEQYQEWLMFRDGRDNATIATALSVDESAIADAEYAFSAMEELYMAATNGVIIQANRLDALRRFT